MILDSGAGASVANGKKHFPEWKLRASEGIRKGITYVGAGEERIPNQGERRGRLMFEHGKTGFTTFQEAEVRQPLVAVSETCDKNDICLFTNEKCGSMVAPVRDPIVQEILRLAQQLKDKIEVHRVKGTYHIPAWIVPEEDVGGETGQSPFKGQR